MLGASNWLKAPRFDLYVVWGNTQFAQFLIKSSMCDWLLFLTDSLAHAPGCAPLHPTTQSRAGEVPVTVSIYNSQRCTGACTAWQNGPGYAPHCSRWFFIVYCYFLPTGGGHRVLRFQDEGSLDVMMKTGPAAEALPPQHKWPPCLPSRLTGKVRACVSAYSGDRLVCHTYFHHIKSSSPLFLSGRWTGILG